MRDIVFALFMLGTVPFILSRPYVGLLVWAWLGYMNPHRLTFGFAYSFPWVQVIAILTLISLAMSNESKKVRITPTVVLMFLFFAWTTLATFFAVQPDTAWQGWDRFGKALVMVLVTFMLVKDRQRMHWLVWLIAVSIGFYGVRGGVFTALTGGSYHVFGPAQSFIAGNNDLAQALCMVLPLMRYLQLHTPQKYLRWGLALAMLLTGIAILGTYSRGGLIALVVVGGALILKSRKRIAIVFVLVALGVVAYQFMPQKWTARMATIQHGSTVNTAETRIQSWEFATNLAIHHPILGGGYNVYESSQMWAKYGPEGAIQRAVHSIYFRVLGEQGFPGILLFLGLLFVSWRCCTKIRRATRDLPGDKWAFDLASMLQVSLLAFMTAGLATTSSYFDLSFQLMAMCGLLWVMVQDGQASRIAVDGAISDQASPSARAALVQSPLK